MMKKFILMSIIIQVATCIKVRSCPKIECDENAVATDSDDWCVRVNYFDSRAGEATVQIRKCNGTRKAFCEWGMPHMHHKFIWPFH